MTKLGSVVTAFAIVSGAFALPGLKVSGKDVVTDTGEKILLKGTSLGSLFVMEPWMSPLNNVPDNETDYYSVLTTLNERFGEEKQEKLRDAYYEAWMGEDDFAKIAAEGLNHVRVPVWWGQFVKISNPTPDGWRDDAFAQLDRIVGLAEKHGLYVIIDMHGAFGGQSDAMTTGRAHDNTYWSSETNKKYTRWLWGKIAEHYKGNTTIAGFDILNEPYGDGTIGGLVHETGLAVFDKFYFLDEFNRMYKAIRDADPSRIVIMEDTFGLWQFSQLTHPSVYKWENVMYSSHPYPRLPVRPERLLHLQGAGKDYADVKLAVDSDIAELESTHWNVPGYMGEWQGYNKSESFSYAMKTFGEHGMNWAFWAYKATEVDRMWGLYNPVGVVEKPTIATDSYEAILSNWQSWTTDAKFKKNVAVFGK